MTTPDTSHMLRSEMAPPTDFPEGYALQAPTVDDYNKAFDFLGRFAKAPQERQAGFVKYIADGTPAQRLALENTLSDRVSVSGADEATTAEMAARARKLVSTTADSTPAANQALGNIHDAVSTEIDFDYARNFIRRMAGSEAYGISISDIATLGYNESKALRQLLDIQRRRQQGEPVVMRKADQPLFEYLDKHPLCADRLEEAVERHHTASFAPSPTEGDHDSGADIGADDENDAWDTSRLGMPQGDAKKRTAFWDAYKAAMTVKFLKAVRKAQWLGKEADTDQRIARLKFIGAVAVPVVIAATGRFLKVDLQHLFTDIPQAAWDHQPAAAHVSHNPEDYNQGRPDFIPNNNNELKATPDTLDVPDNHQAEYPHSQPASGHSQPAQPEAAPPTDEQQLDSRDIDGGLGPVDPPESQTRNPGNYDHGRPDFIPEDNEVKPEPTTTGTDMPDNRQSEAREPSADPNAPQGHGHDFDEQKTSTKPEPDTSKPAADKQPHQGEPQPANPDQPDNQGPKVIEHNREVPAFENYNATNGDGTLWNWQQSYGKNLGEPMTDQQTQALTQALLNKNGMTWQQAYEVQNVGGQPYFHGHAIAQLNENMARQILAANR